MEDRPWSGASASGSGPAPGSRRGRRSAELPPTTQSQDLSDLSDPQVAFRRGTVSRGSSNDAPASRPSYESRAALDELDALLTQQVSLSRGSSSRGSSRGGDQLGYAQSYLSEQSYLPEFSRQAESSLPFDISATSAPPTHVPQSHVPQSHLPQSHVPQQPHVVALAPPAAAAAMPGDKEMGVFAALPSGQHVQIDILSTWGDPYYVGLSALEIFDEHGQPVELEEPQQQIRADPADINVLPEYGHDVRVVSNLFDGTLRTCDDAHLWLAPFTPGRRNYIYVDLSFPRSISMVRVWNYNKSRIHSFRGARLLELRLDGNLVFRGEVNKAPGALHEVEKAAEPILFTMEPAILGRIEEHDAVLFEFEPVAELPSAVRERPSTAERHHERGGVPTSLRPSEDEVPETVRSALERPRTAAFNAMLASCQASVPPHRDRRSGAGYSDSAGAGSGGEGSASCSGVPSVSELQGYMTHVHPAGRQLRLQLLSTWGDPHYIGLNGIQLLSPTKAFWWALCRAMAHGCRRAHPQATEGAQASEHVDKDQKAHRTCASLLWWRSSQVGVHPAGAAAGAVGRGDGNACSGRA